jgi:3-methyladenine DNA glycosylase AlkD
LASRPKAGTSDQVAELTAFVQRELKSRADSRNAIAMAAYMKTSMPFYGVPKPARAEISRELKRRFSIANQKQYERAVRGLWKLPHREEKYFAIDVARTWRAFIVPASMLLYRRLIEEGAWWDTVDEIAVHLVGAVLLAHRREIAPMMDRWIEDANLWIRRAAIISQLKHKDLTDHVRLFRYSLAQASDKEFFIRKAIGWALRQYAYSAPERVSDYLAHHRDKLSPLTYREAARVLIKQGVMAKA